MKFSRSWLVALFAVVATLMSTSAAANAEVPAGPEPTDIAPMSAFGTEPISSFSYSLDGTTFKIPTGSFLSHYIDGSGKRINAERAGVDRVGPAYWTGMICNWRIDFDYYDLNQKHYKHNRGETHTTCDWSPFRSYNVATQLAHNGQACAVFYVMNAQRARQCHYITG